MRCREQNLGEKRVLFNSLEKKNSLRLSYEKLHLEEKAFVSSTKFDRRQLLSRQRKLRQLGTTPQLSRISSLPKIPGVPAQDESPRYPRTFTTVHSKITSRDGGSFNRLLGRKASDGKQSRVNIERIHELVDTVLREKRTVNLEESLKTNENRRANFSVNDRDLVATLGEKEKRFQSKKAVVDIDDVGGCQTNLSESTKKISNSSAMKEVLRKSGSLSSLSSTRTSVSDSQKQHGFKPKEKTKGTEENEVNLGREPSTENLRFSEARMSKVMRSPANDEKDPEAVSKDILVNSLKQNLAVDSRTETKECVRNNEEFQRGPFEDQEKELFDDSSNAEKRTNEDGRLKVFITLEQEEAVEDTHEVGHLKGTGTGPVMERPSSSCPKLVSRKPSWNGTEALPAMGCIRRGSFCDVKTFTSGKVLDLLSTCKVSMLDKCDSKQYLDVETDELKYCRYLRPVKSDEAIKDDDADSLNIPMKFRPSKNIIIGHTKLPLSK